MTLITHFNEINAWQKAHELTLEIYEISQHFPKEELFCLTNQIRRCAISVPSNIAEGFARKSKIESLRFYNISEGSLEELKYQLLLSRDLKYITIEKWEELTTLANLTGKLLNGWMKIQK